MAKAKATPGFVHLHTHSEYSLLDGASRVADLVSRSVELGMPALALTDHGVMYGAIEFYDAARKADLKAIIGCEVYVASNSRFDRSPKKEDHYDHLVLLAENLEGYRNLLKLVSLAYLEGFYYKPRVDLELLREHNAGLIALSACLSGKVPRLFLENDPHGAEAAARELSEIFGEGRFYLELQRTGIEEQEKAIKGLLGLSKKLDLPLVATNDSHYLRREDSSAHDALLCIQTGSTLDEQNRMKFSTDEYYLRSPEEMAELFSDIPEALENSLAIAERCNVELDLGEIILPDYSVPEGHTLDSYLESLCREGLARRYAELTPEITDRLEHELSVITDMGFSGYFLVVWDFVRHAKEKGIKVGPGRGSAAGSIVAYALGITNIDPLKNGLLFERFLNPSRRTMPDIDIDFDDLRRPEVIAYVTEKYGEDHVAQIITFGRMLARAATRDAGRVLNLPYGAVDRWAKLINEETIAASIEANAELKAIYETESDAKRTLDTAQALEGLARQDSIHAAGVVISREEITNYTPIQRKGEAETVTQYSMEAINRIGLLKMDFLGLRTLTVIARALEIIRKKKGLEIDIDAVPLDDEATYKLLQKGDTVGVFQLESSGMRGLIRDLKPARFEDLVALLALYRPGPLGSGMVHDFVDRRHGRKAIQYPHESLEPILEETYGIMVYQEQVMRIAGAMAGFSMAEADILRGAMSKKKPEVLAEQREKFVAGAAAQGIAPKTAEEVFDLVLHFAGYGFNKSHSTAYAVISYQTAYLKANYTGEFMAALLSSNAGNKDKVAEYVQECRRLGIKVLPPDINSSEIDFTVEEDVILFGLSAVRNIGEGLVEGILKARKKEPLTGLYEFVSQLDPGTVNKRGIESLIKAGAFDSLGFGRRALLLQYEPIVDRANRDQRDRAAGQFSLFGESGARHGQDGPGEDRDTTSVGVPVIAPMEEFPKKELLAHEKEMLGLYVSDHPLYGLEATLDKAGDCPIGGLKNKPDGSWVTIAGLISKITRKATKRGEIMLFLTIEDLSSSIETIAFPGAARDFEEHLVEDQVIVIRGRLDHKEDEVKLILQEAKPLERTEGEEAKGDHPLTISLPTGPLSAEMLDDLGEILSNHKGGLQVLIEVPQNGSAVVLQLGEAFGVAPSQGLYAELKALLPEECIAR